ncbi:MAG: hypothetical protein CSB13_01405 [Chloroflexi bacterium]|nr:MAG: hypothetical protein CSB13_01405 [Chloroflexota bacterium]
MDETNLRLKEAAELIGVHKSTLQRWLNDREYKEKHFPASYRVKPGSKTSPWVVMRDEVGQFIEKRAKASA